VLARPPAKAIKKEAYDAKELHPPATINVTPAGVTSVQTFIGGPAYAESLERLAPATAPPPGLKSTASQVSPAAFGCATGHKLSLEILMAQARRLPSRRKVEVSLRSCSLAERRWC
jgi:hypothetical protein